MSGWIPWEWPKDKSRKYGPPHASWDQYECRLCETHGSLAKLTWAEELPGWICESCDQERET